MLFALVLSYIYLIFTTNASMSSDNIWLNSLFQDYGKHLLLPFLITVFLIKLIKLINIKFLTIFYFDKINFFTQKYIVIFSLIFLFICSLSFLNLISTYVISSRYLVILLPFISIFLTPIIAYVLSNEFSPVYFNLEKKIIPTFIFIYFIFSIINLVLPYSNSKLSFYNSIGNDEFLKSKCEIEEKHKKEIDFSSCKNYSETRQYGKVNFSFFNFV